MSKKPEFSEYREGDYGLELLCPHCGFQYLHHYKIEVFDRKEDAETGTHTTVNRGEVSLSTNLDGNPSMRRGGISIHFWCEGYCRKPIILQVFQHKGLTFMNWNDTIEQTDKPYGDRPFTE